MYSNNRLFVFKKYDIILSEYLILDNVFFNLNTSF